MILYIALAGLTITLGAFVRVCPVKGSRQQALNRVLLAAVFSALFLVSALRINVGNDYGNYVEFMHRIYSNAFHEVPTEIGFNLLTYGIYHLFGFENYVAVFAVFAAVTIALFLYTLYRLSDDFSMSFLMFMLLGYYYMSISTIRYYLALSIALFSVYHLLRRDVVAFVLLVLAGACFHKSLLVVLLLYPLAMIPWKKWMAVPLALLCISFLLFPAQYLQLLVTLYPSYRDTAYLSGGTSVFNVLRLVLVLTLAAWVLQKEAEEAAEAEALADTEEFADTVSLIFYTKLQVLALLLYTFCAFLPVISRIGYYLTVVQLLLVPALIKRIRFEQARRLLKGALLVLCAAYFTYFMLHAGDDGIRLLPYKTVLFDEMPPILSEVGY